MVALPVYSIIYWPCTMTSYRTVVVFYRATQAFPFPVKTKFWS